MGSCFLLSLSVFVIAVVFEFSVEANMVAYTLSEYSGATLPPNYKL
jgi:hypothetical protein